jgi:O-antigen ligase
MKSGPELAKGRAGDILSPLRPFVVSPFLWLAIALLAAPFALLPIPTLALVLFYTLLILLAFADPVFGLYWAILSVPVQEVAHVPGGLSYTQAAMLLAASAWAARVLAHPERRVLEDDRTARAAARPLWLWAAFLWALLLAAVCSPFSRTEGLKETLRWLEAFLIWLMVVALVRRPWQLAGLIACLLLAPAAEAAIGLAQFIAGSGPPSFRIAPDLPFVRAYGTIGQPNSFAGYMNMAWPLALALAVRAVLSLRRGGQTAGGGGEQAQIRGGEVAPDHRRLVLSPSHRFGLWLGLLALSLLLLAALAASLSRGAWVGAACGVVGLALALGPRARAWSLAGLGVVALGLVLGGAGLLPAVLADRLASITRYLTIFDAGVAATTPQNFAVVERMAQMQAGWRMFLAHPLTGVGPGSYTLAYPHFAVGAWYASRGHAHNYYIHIAAESGILGALAYLALLCSIIRQAAMVVRSSNRTIWRSAAIGCCGIIAAVVGHDLFENLHALSMGIQLATVWGLLVVLEQPMAGE